METSERTVGAAPYPFVIAHRWGNSLSALHVAERLSVPAVEADIHLFRGRLEVRHLKTVGPLPVLWDRWELGNPFVPRLLVSELLAAVGPRTHLVLDLKGRNRRLSDVLLRALDPYLSPTHAVTLCARSWPLLELFRSVPGVRGVHSVGSGKDLAQLRSRIAGSRSAGISIHERLLDRRTTQELRGLANMILSWPVNTTERARELIAYGVDGLISDRPGALQSVLGRRVEPKETWTACRA